MPPRPVRKSKCCRPGRSGKGFVAVLVMGGIAAVVMHEAAGPRRPAPPPEPTRIDRMSARTLTRHLAETGPVGAAQAADKYLAAQALPTVHPQGVDAARSPAAARPPVAPAAATSLFVKAKSLDSHTRTDQAETDALEVAGKGLTQQFAELHPPLVVEVTAADVRTKYLKPETIAVVRPTAAIAADWEKNGLDPKQVWVELEAEVTPSQVRELRAHGRVGLAVRGIGMMLACLAAAAAFFRLDTLTRGYLSWGLGLGLAGAAAGAVAGLWLLV